MISIDAICNTSRMPSPRATPLRIAAVPVAVAALLLAGCGGSSDTATGVRATRASVSFTACGKVACDGTLNGAKYRIVMPTTWNGTLLLYSHGYRSEQPTPPAFEPVDESAVPAPGEDVAKALLAKGYALAGSGYKSNGWAVQDGVAADEQLYAFFADKIGKPDRTLVWGDSLGGLVTQTLAEKKHDWVSGAAPLCGVMAGTNANFDVGLDLGVAVKALVDPSFTVTGYSSYTAATDAWKGVAAKVLASGSDIANGVPRILFIAALLDAPGRTKTYDGSTIESTVRAKAETLLTGLGLATYGRYELEERVGGNPSTNEGVDYASRISPAERTLIDTVSPGATDRLLAAMAAAPRIAADPKARAAADRLGDPTGNLTVPTITMHTTDDPLVLVQNQGVFRQRVDTATARSSDLVQVFTTAPPTYPSDPGAPYGAGHCNFSTNERVGVISVLDRWVRLGVHPSLASVAEAIGEPSGIAAGYQPGPWPGRPQDVPAPKG